MNYLSFKDHWPQPGSQIAVLVKQKLPSLVDQPRILPQYDADMMLHVDINEMGRWSGFNDLQPWEIEVVAWKRRCFAANLIDDFKTAPLARPRRPN